MSPIVLIFENMHSFKIQPTFKPEINELFDPAKNIIEISKGELRPVFLVACTKIAHPVSSPHAHERHRTCALTFATHSLKRSSSQSTVSPLFWCSLKSGLNWPKMEMSRMIMQARIFFMPNPDFSREVWIFQGKSGFCTLVQDLVLHLLECQTHQIIKTMLK